MRQWDEWTDISCIQRVYQCKTFVNFCCGHSGVLMLFIPLTTVNGIVETKIKNGKLTVNEFAVDVVLVFSLLIRDNWNRKIRKISKFVLYWWPHCTLNEHINTVISNLFAIKIFWIADQLHYKTTNMEWKRLLHRTKLSSHSYKICNKRPNNALSNLNYCNYPLFVHKNLMKWILH